MIVLIAAFAGCYHNFQPTELSVEEARGKEIVSPAKCHLMDGSVVVFDRGFVVGANVLTGYGVRYPLAGKDATTVVSTVALDSIVAITTYSDYTPGRQFANGTLSFFGTVLSALAIYCVSCPKCCFGSCPTVYSLEGADSSLETELFSSSIAKLLEERDVDQLKQPIPDNGRYKLRITNEAMETHYIDKFNLLLAEHPKGTLAFPNTNGDLTIVSKLGNITKAVNSEGFDVTADVSNDDKVSYRSGMEMVKELRVSPRFDFVEFTSDVPEGAKVAKVVVKYKNTLLSTILLYDVVFGSQGIHAIQWNERMNKDEGYANDFRMIYDNFSGMKLEAGEGAASGLMKRFPDAGPIAWKYVAAEMQVDGLEDLELRLSFIPDNMMIDYIGIEYDGPDNGSISQKIIYPVDAEGNTDLSGNEALELLANADGRYLVTEPGEAYTLTYSLGKREDCEQSLFIVSEGYYNEWVRGSWVRNDSTARPFDLYDIGGNLSRLSESWESNKALIESEFFNARIPVKEKSK